MSKKKSVAPPKTGPKILILDIESKPLTTYTWGLFDQNIPLNMIKEDWSILSWAAKWLGEKEVFYEDLSKAKDVHNDKELLKGIWKLLDECDVVVGQNSNSFDLKKLYARFIIHGMPPPSSFKKLDTLRIAKAKFGFTSNKLEYLSEKLCTKYKKLKHKKYPGFELWDQCLRGNKDAWRTMREYNVHDILATEELFIKLRPYDNSFNPNVYTNTLDTVCACGSKEIKLNGYSYTSTGKYQRHACKKCGAEVRSRENLLSKEKKKSLKAKA